MENYGSNLGQVSQRSRKKQDRGLIVAAWLIFGLGIALMLMGIGAFASLRLDNHPFWKPFSEIIVSAAVVIANGVIGILIISRFPNHKIGWLLLVTSLLYALSDFCDVFYTGNELLLTDPSNPLIKFFIWLGSWIWLPYVILPLFYLPLYFPSGHLLSYRWRFFVYAGGVGLFAGCVSIAIHPGPFELIGASGINPYPLPGGAVTAEILWLYGVMPLLLVTMVGSYVSLILRFRNAGTVERTQMKWVIYFITVGLSLIFLGTLITFLLPDRYLLIANNMSNWAVWILTIGIPVMMGIAILRYRLYDIDLIIRRTLIYGALTLTLVLIYLGSVIIMQRVLGFLVTSESPVVLVVSTLAIAALFNPLRRRIQDVIDRRFYRRKYDARATLNQFAAAMREESDLQDLVGKLAAVVEETMKPEVVTVWLAKPPAEQLDQDYAK